MMFLKFLAILGGSGIMFMGFSAFIIPILTGNGFLWWLATIPLLWVGFKICWWGWASLALY